MFYSFTSEVLEERGKREGVKERGVKERGVKERGVKERGFILESHSCSVAHGLRTRRLQTTSKPSKNECAEESTKDYMGT